MSTRESARETDVVVTRRGALRTALGAAVAGAVAQTPARAVADEGGGRYMSFEELEGRARAAYRAKDLDEAYDLLTRIIGMEPENGVWYERRAQVQVDLKRFQSAIVRR